MSKEFKEIPLNQIIVIDNTRKTFTEQKLNELAQSIRENGVLEPILVRPRIEGTFDLIAGERRLRAAFIAGLITIPALIEDMDDEQALSANIIENLQREGLRYMEQALAIRRFRDENDLTYQEVAQKLGKSKALISSYINLTKLPDDVIEICKLEELTADVAILISRIPDPDNQLKCAQDLRRKKKDKRISRRTACGYIAEMLGTKSVLSKQKRFKKGMYESEWKKYLVAFSEKQFNLWKKIVEGRTETAVLADAVEIVMCGGE